MSTFKLSALFSVLLGGALCCLPVSSAVAQDAGSEKTSENGPAAGTLSGAAELIAKRVAQYAATRDQKTIFVRKFEGPLDNSAARGIEVAVREQLQLQKMTVLTNKADIQEKQAWILGGKLSVRKSSGIALVTVSLQDSDEGEVDEFKQEFNQSKDAVGDAIRTAQQQAPADVVEKNPSTLPITGGDASILGGVNQDVVAKVAEQEKKTAEQLIAPASSGAKSSLPPGIGGQIAEEVRTASFQKPSVEVQGTVVQPTPESLFKVRIWMSMNPNGPFHPVEVRKQSGVARVDLPPDAYYEVELINQSSVPVGVEVIIDGINVLRFSETEAIRASGKWQLPPTPPDSKARRISGWFRKPGPGGTDRFKVSNFANAVAVQLGEAQETGMIQARFFTAREVGTPAPLIDEILAGGNDRAGGFTAKGQPIDNNVTIRDVVFGAEPLTLITVRYDNPDEDLPPGNAPAN